MPPEDDKITEELEGAGQPPEFKELNKSLPSTFLNPMPGIPAMSAPPRPAPRPANENINIKSMGGGPPPRTLPQPLTIEDRAWQNYASKMSPDEFLKSEALWGGSKRLSEQNGTLWHEEFANLANEMFGRMGVNKFLSPTAAHKIMGEQRGVGAVK